MDVVNSSDEELMKEWDFIDKTKIDSAPYNSDEESIEIIEREVLDLSTTSGDESDINALKEADIKNNEISNEQDISGNDVKQYYFHTSLITVTIVIVVSCMQFVAYFNKTDELPMVNRSDWKLPDAEPPMEIVHMLGELEAKVTPVFKSINEMIDLMRSVTFINYTTYRLNIPLLRSDNQETSTVLRNIQHSIKVPDEEFVNDNGKYDMLLNKETLHRSLEKYVYYVNTRVNELEIMNDLMLNYLLKEMKGSSRKSEAITIGQNDDYENHSLSSSDEDDLKNVGNTIDMTETNTFSKEQYQYIEENMVNSLKLLVNFPIIGQEELACIDNNNIVNEMKMSKKSKQDTGKSIHKHINKYATKDDDDDDDDKAKSEIEYNKVRKYCGKKGNDRKCLKKINEYILKSGLKCQEIIAKDQRAPKRQVNEICEMKYSNQYKKFHLENEAKCQSSRYMQDNVVGKKNICDKNSDFCVPLKMNEKLDMSNWYWNRFTILSRDSNNNYVASNEEISITKYPKGRSKLLQEEKRKMKQGRHFEANEIIDRIKVVQSKLFSSTWLVNKQDKLTKFSKKLSKNLEKVLNKLQKQYYKLLFSM